MQKRVFIVHGWEGYPEEGWFPWLKKELEANGFAVFVPQLPKPEEPRIKAWVSKLSEVVGAPDRQAYFVGHSIGCQTIARYLETLLEGVMAGGAVFVAGFFKRLTGLEEDDLVRDVAKEWLTTPIDLQKVKAHLGKSIAIFSDDDPYVPAENQGDFREKLGSKVIALSGGGHFSGSMNKCFMLPEALMALLELVGENR
ncbi:MAG: hypothetical protein A2945_00990 [Candidatus Liptonbacteria bacterium RIFCSPLOWO2_01_FULL_52_25]|uniref:Alpha/beta hydrolase n=1 Tax=Candidatus Liptonbacteria bacterium RIFCSPLOWO2_01_FULL_52_25 TaxID=1798650 RepID=A0A1G2CDW2_9BACT|nr:MAG: hypothetical protein A2945_00990 [Candidatus Liptonbacteria bacterium RIFCSPLOWO2_01_FULL_52_25]